ETKKTRRRRSPGGTPHRAELVLRPLADDEAHLRAVRAMAAGPRALPHDLALLLLGRLRVRHLADLAVGGADPRLCGGQLLADHLRHDTSGRRQLPVER